MKKWAYKILPNTSRTTFIAGITLIVYFIGGNVCVAQTLVHYKVREMDTVYEMKADASLKETNIFFPNYDEWKELRKGYELPHNATLTLVKQDAMLSGSRPLLYIRVYSKNVKQIRVKMGDGEEQLLLPFTRDGYQFPEGVDIRSLMADKQPSRAVVHLICEPAYPGKKMLLVLGEMRVCTDRVADYLSPVKIFQQSPFANPPDNAAYKLSPFESYGYYTHYPAGEVEEATKAALFISDTTRDAKSLLGLALLGLLGNYPFFAEKHLVKEQVVEEVQHMLDRTRMLPLCGVVDTLNQYLLTHFNDPHFFIRSDCNTKAQVLSPIQVYPINGKIEVAAVLDDTLKNIIPLGSRVTGIDGSRIGERSSAAEVNRLLRRKSGELIAVSFDLPGGKLAEITYRIAERYKTPDNMMPVNLQYRKLNDSTAYYKINRIDARLPTDFASRLDSINGASRLVIDLRSCGGGDLLAGAEFLSYIIGHSFRYFDLVEVNGNREDSTIVRANPSPFHYRKDGRIILLVDRNTACTAELLIHNLKTWKSGTTIWGKEGTRGALAIIHDISLPTGNIGIGTNAIGNWKMLLNKKSIEGIGIPPDRVVRIENIYDLQPYNDKVLQLAIGQ